jgi:hypothetical protein
MGLTIGDVMSGLLALPGFRYACVADPESGAVLDEAGVAGVSVESVLRWAREAADVLARGSDGGLDDLILTSRAGYHLVRSFDRERLLLYLCVDRARSNLALSRRELATVRLGRPGGPPAPDATPRATAGPSPGAAGGPATSMPTQVVPAAQTWLAAPITIERRGGTPPASPPGAGEPGPAGQDGAVRVPLPRRNPSALPPPARPVPTGDPAGGGGAGDVPSSPTGLPGPPAGRAWANDIASIKRLLTGLRAMM